MKPSFIILIGVLVAAILLSFGLVWFVFLKPAPAAKTGNTTTVGLGSGTTKSVGTSPATTDTNTSQPLAGTQASKQKVFKIADGPVTGAAFIQTLYPTTTLVRYVLQENGHVLDYPLDTPGALPKAASNTTIPGTQKAVWGAHGQTLFLQYLDSDTVKTVSLLFPAATSSRSSAKPPQIQFFPDTIRDLALSPDGQQAVYLLPASARGVDGYIAKPDGSDAKKIFSLPLSEMLVSWPAAGTLLLTTRSAAQVPGMVFSADPKSGNVTPLIYAQGLTATANRSFTSIVYQTAAAGQAARHTYVHTVKSGTDAALSFDPIPEKCAWSETSTSTIYCAIPSRYIASSYLDLWHMGAASQSDTIESYTLGVLNRSHDVAEPGSADGGVASDIESLAVSPDDKYLLFVKKGDRSLWAVRLEQGN